MRFMMMTIIMHDDYNDGDDNFADDDYDHDDYIIRANWLGLFFKLSTSGVDDYDDDIDGYNIQSPRTVHHCSSDNQVLQGRPRQRQVFLQVPKLTTSNTIIFLILTLSLFTGLNLEDSLSISSLMSTREGIN